MWDIKLPLQKQKNEQLWGAQRKKCESVGVEEGGLSVSIIEFRSMY